MAKMRRFSSTLANLVCLILCWFEGAGASLATGTLAAGQAMRDWQFLESQSTRFRLRFFSPKFSTNRYLGIQYMPSVDPPGEESEGSIVWVANRENPLMDTSGVLNITQDGNMVISYSYGTFITISSKQPSVRNNISARLFDSGNLVLRAGDEVLWQSFDYPSNTLLPGMKLGLFDVKKKQPRKQFLTSWLSPYDPASGAFTLGVDPNNTKKLAVWRRGLIYWRSGDWNGTDFTSCFSVYMFRVSYFSNENESYFTFSPFDINILSSWMKLKSSGEVKEFGMSNDTIDESVYFHSLCNDIFCCVMPKPPKCRRGNEFFRTTMPYIGPFHKLENYSLGPGDCIETCTSNCSCEGYSTLYPNQTGCVFFYQDQINGYGDYWDPQGAAVYMWKSYVVKKVEATAPIHTVYQLPIVEHARRARKMQPGFTIGAPVVSLIVLILVSLWCYLRWRSCCCRGKYRGNQEDEILMYELGTAIDELSDTRKPEQSGKKNHELSLFSFSSIQIATGNFDDENKLGQGGFGPVYKGILVDGREIAVKRLSRRSGQGLKEFKNEVILISKLQHRNLVRLLGCCIQGEERILAYEYLPNKSLDMFLSDATKRGLLDWKIRFCIIEGIAQGLLYLHKYSRMKIIHRDLKTSNVLRDANMNPKISDFGTTRIFGENESQANTNRIVGTYGYMSPEYAMDGLFSEKSDVFSFGVMCLEIVSGMKNNGFYQSDRFLNLLAYAWDLWKDGKTLELIDFALDEKYSTNEALRCVQVGLLCVQESAADRPIMSDVVSMLGNELMTLPTPKQPAFSNISSVNNVDIPENPRPCSVNHVTISDIEAR